VIGGETAQKISGSPAEFTIRPEKIHLQEPGQPIGAGMCSIWGTIREVVYLGAHTRYQVDLTGGGELVVVQQNLHTTSMDALAARGRAVQLVWDREHNRLVAQKN
jgi:putative spermidine/putrescine transport system ATP-binding protein